MSQQTPGRLTRMVHSVYGDQRTPHFPQRSYCVPASEVDGLELECARLKAELAELAKALQAFISATDSGGMTEMRSIEGRTVFYERIDTCRDIARSALDRTLP